MSKLVKAQDTQKSQRYDLINWLIYLILTLLVFVTFNRQLFVITSSVKVIFCHKFGGEFLIINMVVYIDHLGIRPSGNPSFQKSFTLLWECEFNPQNLQIYVCVFYHISKKKYIWLFILEGKLFETSVYIQYLLILVL